jgi:hypothetical protein
LGGEKWGKETNNMVCETDLVNLLEPTGPVQDCNGSALLLK